jgi:hypothetical protein
MGLGVATARLVPGTTLRWLPPGGCLSVRGIAWRCDYARPSASFSSPRWCMHLGCEGNSAAMPACENSQRENAQERSRLLAAISRVCADALSWADETKGQVT